MKSTIKVVAKDPENRPVFMCVPRRLVDGKDTTLIGAEPVDVPNERYYQMRLLEGDLVEVKE